MSDTLRKLVADALDDVSEVMIFEPEVSDAIVDAVIAKLTSGGKAKVFAPGVMPDRYYCGDGKTGWTATIIEHLWSGQERAYGPTIKRTRVTFAGGTPSSIPGMELPMASAPPFDPDHQPVISLRSDVKPKTQEERWRAHEDRIKQRILGLGVAAWQYDKTVGERASGPFDTFLKAFRHVPEMSGIGWNTYEVETETPSTD